MNPLSVRARTSFAVLHSLVPTLAMFWLPMTGHAMRTASAPIPAVARPPEPVLRVSVAASIDDAALLLTWLEERNPEIDEALAVPNHEQWVAVQIDGTTYDYRVTVTPMRDGEPFGAISEPFTCECNSESLLARINLEIDAAVHLLRSTPLPVVERTAMRTAPTGAPPPAVPKGASSGPRVWSISPLGIAGVGTGVFGLVAAGAGVAFVVAEERQIDGWSKLDRDFDPLGYATISIGVAAIAGGVAMTVVDCLRLRRSPKRLARASRARWPGSLATSHRVAGLPSYGGGIIGAGFHRRF